MKKNRDNEENCQFPKLRAVQKGGGGGKHVEKLPTGGIESKKDKKYSLLSCHSGLVEGRGRPEKEDPNRREGTTEGERGEGSKNGKAGKRTNRHALVDFVTCVGERASRKKKRT